jgi:small-conductance mechanosensitive channel
MRASVFAAQDGGIGDAFADLSISGWDVVLALVVVVASWLMSRITRRAVARIVTRVEGVSDDLRNLSARLAGYLVLFVGVGIALGILGAQVQPILAAAILIGVVVVLALRGIADNFAAGIVIQSRRPVHVGDEIDALGFVGTVEELNGRAVMIQTQDGRTVHLPNYQLLNGPIVNHTTGVGRRSEVEVRTEATPDAVINLLTEFVATIPGVQDDPTPSVLVTAVEPERTVVKVRFWHEFSAGSAVTSSVVCDVARRLREAGHVAVVEAPPSAAPRTPQAPL